MVWYALLSTPSNTVLLIIGLLPKYQEATDSLHLLPHLPPEVTGFRNPNELFQRAFHDTIFMHAGRPASAKNAVCVEVFSTTMGKGQSSYRPFPFTTQ